MQAKLKASGMTLIEIMIVIVIIGIIAAIAYPNFVDYVREARRADAMGQLLTLQMAEEEYRLKNTTYADIATLGWERVVTFIRFLPVILVLKPTP